MRVTSGSSALWRYLPAQEVSLPPEPRREAVRTGLRDLWNRLRPDDRPSAPAPITRDLSSMPRRLLDRVAAAPRWEDAADALDGALAPWMEEEAPESAVVIVVGPPGSGTAEVIARWARTRQWRLIPPPSPAQILAGGEEWLAGLEEPPDAPLAIPRLERCYLRHQDGLSMLRRLLERLTTGRRRRLVGCDSWALAYLDKALHTDVHLPSRLALEPFGADRFQRWFEDLAAAGRGCRSDFRQADTGEAVLPPPGGAPSCDRSAASGVPSDEGGSRVSDFLEQLAGRSRGIPGVGRAIWRHSFHIAREEEGAWEAAEAAAGEQTIWVRPWPEIGLPSVPPGAGDPEAFVLHTLLLHGGLEGPWLPRLLPLPTAQTMTSLHGLRAAGLVEQEGDVWRVTFSGYPAARQFLRSEGYLVDAF